MTIWQHVQEFDGKPVVDYQPGMALDPQNHYRLRRGYGDEVQFSDLITQFAAADNVDQVTGLVTGAYDDEMYDQSSDMGVVVEAVVSIAPRLPILSGLFLGDIVVEECEVSWIQQTDVSPIWQAFPRLKTLQLRGGDGLSLGEIVHDQLQSLVIESGGLPREVVNQIAAAKLPELRHLVLFLGSDNYGGDSAVEDVMPFLSGELFPKLTYLGLVNSEFQNEIAWAAADSAIVERLEVLDLSKGELTDEGADALLAKGDRFASLKKLDLSHHFMSNEVMKKFADFPCEVDVSDQQEADVYGDDVYRYIALSE